jgi:hypothetical protein
MRIVWLAVALVVARDDTTPSPDDNRFGGLRKRRLVHRSIRMCVRRLVGSSAVLLAACVFAPDRLVVATDRQTYELMPIGYTNRLSAEIRVQLHNDSDQLLYMGGCDHRGITRVEYWKGIAWGEFYTIGMWGCWDYGLPLGHLAPGETHEYTIGVGEAGRYRLRVWYGYDYDSERDHNVESNVFVVEG